MMVGLLTAQITEKANEDTFRMTPLLGSLNLSVVAGSRKKVMLLTPETNVE